MAKVTKVSKSKVVYRVSKIEADKHKKKIDEDLLNRDSFKQIGERYGYTGAEISKYYKDRLLPQLAKSIREERKEEVGEIIGKLTNTMVKLDKLLRACDLWLTDPDNPDEYNLNPRASEIIVVYNELVMGERGAKNVRHKKSLQELLLETSDLYENVLQLNSKSADPRELILKTSSEVREQLKLIAEITGQLKNVGTGININVLAPNIVNSIIKATSNNTEMQNNIVSEIMRTINASKEPNEVQ